LPPQTDSVVYQKQKYGAHSEPDSGIVKEEPINKEYSEVIPNLPRKAHQIAGRTFVIISQEIVDKLRIDEDTWFKQEIIGNRVILRILDWNEEGGRI
jgi:hypothetical protein